jgi:hypothetical protein
VPGTVATRALSEGADKAEDPPSADEAAIAQESAAIA